MEWQIWIASSHSLVKIIEILRNYVQISFFPLGLARHDSATEPGDTEYETHSLTLVCILIRIYSLVKKWQAGDDWESLRIVREIAWIWVMRSTLEYRAALGVRHFIPTVRARASLGEHENWLKDKIRDAFLRTRTVVDSLLGKCKSYTAHTLLYCIITCNALLSRAPSRAQGLHSSISLCMCIHLTTRNVTHLLHVQSWS